MASNGRLPSSSLARIYHPRVKVFLRRDMAAAWNSFALFVWYATRQRVYPTGPMAAYRTFAQQVYLWNLYQSGRGNLAARPGTSNHGWGLAIDLATRAMRSLVDRFGAAFGLAKRWSDAPSEWWHIRWRAGVWRAHPNPGPSVIYPRLQLGSGGPGQAAAVKECQARLRIHTTGHFDSHTQHALKRFQTRHRLQATGVTNVATWRKLRARR